MEKKQEAMKTLITLQLNGARPTARACRPRSARWPAAAELRAARADSPHISHASRRSNPAPLAAPDAPDDPDAPDAAPARSHRSLPTRSPSPSTRCVFAMQASRCPRC